MDYRHIICLISAAICFFLAFLMWATDNIFGAVVLVYFASEFVWHALGWKSHIH